MILPRYRIAPSRIPGAGQGLFLDEAVAAGRVVVAPDAIPGTTSWAQVQARPDREQAMAANVVEHQPAGAPSITDVLEQQIEAIDAAFRESIKPLPAGTVEVMLTAAILRESNVRISLVNIRFALQTLALRVKFGE